METSELPLVERVAVFQGDDRVGVLERQRGGASFRYDESYRGKGIAFSLPSSQLTHSVSGFNLHPFFAGLLPEGLRLVALRDTIKTSADDLFSILLAQGSNSIGDVSVRLQVTADAQFPAVENLADVSFEELFEKCITSKELVTRELDPGIAGVMPKVSSSMISFPVNLAARRKQYILKLGTPKHDKLVENEHFFMNMAAACGIETAAVKLVYDRNMHPGLLVERFDRVYDKTNKRFQKLHVEDACQFLNEYPSEKYRLSVQQIADGLITFVGAPMVEVRKLIALISFSYLIGNGDLHGKNISIFDDRGLFRLSPAYDLLSTLPYGDSRMALRLFGKDDSLTGLLMGDFGDRYGLPKRSVASLLKKLLKGASTFRSQLSEIGLSDKKTLHLQREFDKRGKNLLEGLD